MRTGRVLAVVALVACLAPAGAAAAPNIVLIETDDQSVESLRVMSRTRDLIGARGTTFANSFASYSLCCPSRATTLTGQYAHNHGVLSNQAPTGGYYKLDSSNTLAVWLQREGYATVHLGKYLNGYGTRNAAEVPPGWTEWHGLVDPTTYRFFGYQFNDSGTLTTFGSQPADYQTDVIGSRAVEIIRRRAASTQPFFLWVAFLAPHSGAPREADDDQRPGNQRVASPAVADRHRNRFATEPVPRPPSYNEADVSDKPAATVRNRRPLGPETMAAVDENYRQRLESLLAVDEAVGAMLDALGASGELDDTLVVFTSDNGFLHGEHRVPQGKVLPYEPSIRVPLLLRGPGVPAGVTLRQKVANIDIAPTVLDAADARAGRTMDGQSLLKLARDPTAEPGRDILLETAPAPNTNRLRWTGIRGERYVYLEYASGEREFYDLRTDPDQLQSRHGDPATLGIRYALARRLHRLERCVGDGCRQKPELRLSLAYRRGRTPAGRPCVRGSVRATVGGSDRPDVERVEFTLDDRGRRAKERAPYKRSFPASRLPDGKLVRLRARVSLDDDRVVTLDRRVRGC